MANQSIDPALLALQTARKAMLASPSTQAIVKPSLNTPKQKPQAISTNITPPVAKIGGLSSPFWAPNINSSPVLWWATPTEIGTRAKELKSLPKAMPETWAGDQKDYKSLATSSEKEAFSKMLKDWLSPERASAALKFAIDKRISTEQPKESVLSWILKTAWTIAWTAIPWAWLWWKVLEKVWEKLYSATLNPTQDEAKAIQSYRAWTSNYNPKIATKTMLETPIINPQQWDFSRSFTSKLWWFGTRSMIWEQAEAGAKQLWTSQIQPMISNAKTKFNIQESIAELWSSLEKLAKNDPDKLEEYKNAFSELVQSYSDPKFANMNMQQLQDLKSWLQSRTPNKFFKNQEITDAYRELRGQLSSKLVNKLHTWIENEFWVNSAELYKDYSNMSKLKEIWPKALTEGWRKWWAWWFIDYVAWTLLTPVTTTGGKITYKLWQALQKPQVILNEWIKAVAKWGAKVLKSVIKWWKLFSILDDWTLIPWSPSNLANKAINTPKEERVYIKWSDKLRVSKEEFKMNKDLWKKVVATDLWLVDEEWNLIN